MPEILITAGGSPTPEQGGEALTLRERINVSDFESECFGANLLERIEWAVSDASELERRGPITGRPMPSRPQGAEVPEEPATDRSPEPAGVA